MASFNDYAPKTDELDSEIDEAGNKSAARESSIPERFAGKSAEEIADSYVNLEKLNSKQAQDLGDMRKQVDQLIRQSEEQREAAVKAEEAEVEPLTVDDIYDNPEAAIERVIEKKMRPQIEETQAQLHQQAAEKRLSSFDDTYEGWREKVTTDEFQTWAKSSPYRARMADAVERVGDLDAANDLLAQYYDTQVQAKSETAKAVREEQLADATLESGGAAYSEPAKTFSRTELLETRIAAKQGNQKAKRFLSTNYAAIQAAYSEGRIVD